MHHNARIFGLEIEAFPANGKIVQIVKCFSKSDIDGFPVVYKVNESWKLQIFVEFFYKLQKTYSLHSNIV